MKRLLVVIGIVLSLSSCGKRMGDNVYVDAFSILHVDRNCKNIAVFRGAKPVTMLSLTEIVRTDWKYICPECTSNKDYEAIVSLAERHEMAIDNKRRLYDELSREYDLGTFEQFSIDVNDDGKRRKLYDAIKDDYDLPDFHLFSLQLQGIDISTTEDEEEPTEEGYEPIEEEHWRPGDYDDELMFGRTGH